MKTYLLWSVPRMIDDVEQYIIYRTYCRVSRIKVHQNCRESLIDDVYLCGDTKVPFDEFKP